MFAPALAKSGTMRSTGFTMRCTSIGTRAERRDRFAYRGPDGEIRHVMVVHHVEVHEIGAGRARRASTSSPRRAKSADRMLGAMRKVMSNCTRSSRLEATVRLVARSRFVWNIRMAEEKRNITVTAKVAFVPEQSDVEQDRYVFAYTMTITNTGTAAARLVSRHWIITDSDNKVQEVRGQGVVGEQPLSAPERDVRVHQRHGDRHAGRARCAAATRWSGTTACSSMHRSRSSRCRCRGCCTDVPACRLASGQVHFSSRCSSPRSFRRRAAATSTTR